MEEQKEDIPKEEVPKKGCPKEEVPKEEVAESEATKQEVSKKEDHKKRWRRGYTITILAAVLGALITVFLPRVFNPDKTPPPSPKEQYDRAQRLRDQGAYSEALKLLEELISQQPDYVDAYNLKGRIYLDNFQQYQNAVNEFKRGLKKDPKNKYMLYNLGLSYYWLGDLKQAISFNDSARAQDPDLIIAIYNGALYRVDFGEKYNNGENSYPEAIRLYEIVINLDQEFAAAAMFNLAALHARLARQENNQIVKEQHIKRAIELLDRSIEKEGPERLKKVTDEISVPYGADLRILDPYPDFKAMIKKWKDRFTS